MKLSKKKVIVLALAVCLIAILSIGTLAWFTDTDSVTNKFMVAGSEDQNPDEVFSIDVWEDKTSADPDGESKIQDGIKYDDILPGDDLYKEVNLENTGAYPQYVRATVTVSDAHIWQQLHGEVYIPLNKIATDLNANFQTWSIEYNADEDKLTYVLYYNTTLPAVSNDVVTLFTNIAIPKAMDRKQAAAMAGGFVMDVVAEAVQTENVGDTASAAFATVGMAKPHGNSTILTTAKGLENVLKSGALSTVTLPAELNNTTLTIDYPVANVTIDAAGQNVALVFTDKMENVVVENLVSTDGVTPAVQVEGTATGKLTIKNSTLKDAGGAPNGAAVVKNGDVTFENCTFEGLTGKTYAIYAVSTKGSLALKGCTIKNASSWALQINGAVAGDVLIDGCTFETPDGVLKMSVGGGIAGDFTFTNNTMIGCKGHDGKGQLFSVAVAGTTTFTNNTLDGAAYELA